MHDTAQSKQVVAVVDDVKMLILAKVDIRNGSWKISQTSVSSTIAGGTMIGTRCLIPFLVL